MMNQWQNIFFRFFESPKMVAFFNGIVMLIAIAGNSQLQAFCVPVDWAILVLSVCFLNTIFYPVLLERKKFVRLTSFFNGISIVVLFYCILFLEYINFYGVFATLYFGLGLLVYIPHFLFLQILWKGYLGVSSKDAKNFFISGITLSLLVAGIAVWEYHKALIDIESFRKSGYITLNTNYMTERILGIGIIYHTEICEFDGWRPPKHDPLLNIGLWLHGRENPLNLSLENRVKYYQTFFPDKKVKFDCSCAVQESHLYHNDKLWKQSIIAK